MMYVCMVCVSMLVYDICSKFQQYNPCKVLNI